MQAVKIIDIENLTHDVKKFVVEKPKGYKFVPGQATHITINNKKWESEKRPFTFTSLNEDTNLEFIIKGYEDHNGMTKEIHELKMGDELLIGEAFGAINYKEPGVFIAGGAGITPFIAIFRKLEKENKLSGNKLIFSNKESKDVIMESDLKNWFKGKDLILSLTKEEKPEYEKGRVDENFLKKHITDFSQNFYICGPKEMVKGINNILQSLGVKAESLVFEK